MILLMIMILINKYTPACDLVNILIVIFSIIREVGLRSLTQPTNIEKVGLRSLTQPTKIINLKILDRYFQSLKNYDQ
jgi:hypothetical protein